MTTQAQDVKREIIPPTYQVGEIVDAPWSEINPELKKKGFARCQILFPYEGDLYFVKVLDTGGYCYIPDNIIVSEAKFDYKMQFKRERIRVVFIGNGQFALPTLQMLVERGYDVAAVITMEDKRCGRDRKLRPSAVKEYAESVGLTVFQPKKLDSVRFCRRIQNLHAHLGVVVEFRKLPAKLYDIPKYGTINLHSSILPMYRGASTIASAIRDGSGLTGVTTFRVAEQIDTGNIIANYAIGIEDTDDAFTIFDQLRIIGAEIMDDTLRRIIHHGYTGCVPQDLLINDFIQPSYAPKLHRKDCKIDWNKPARKVFDFIRALSPIPGAWTEISFLKSNVPTDMKILQTELTGKKRDWRAPGELFRDSKHLYIACADELLEIVRLQMPNKRPMTAREFMNGFRDACKGFCNLSYEQSYEHGKDKVKSAENKSPVATKD